MAGNFIAGLTQGAPTVLDTLDQLNKARSQRIANALNQIKLNYAPQMAQQGADLGAANVSIKQNEAKYAPQMSIADLAYKHAETIRAYAASKGEELDNVIKKAKAAHADESVQNDLQIQRAKLGLIEAQANQASSKAKSLSGAPVKGAPAYLDPTTGQAIPGLTEQQATGAAPSSSDNTAMAATPPSPAASSPQEAPAEPGETFPGANPKAMNVLAPVGIPDARGHPVSLKNLRTGESFAVMTPQGREKSRIQLSALRQAIPYMDDLVKYGTVGYIGASGKNKLLPNWFGGVPVGTAANYDATLNKAVEHVIAGSNLKQTETTLPMIHAVLSRQTWENPTDYTNRIHEFKHHLQNLENDTKNGLSSGYYSLDKYSAEAEDKYLTQQYSNLMSKNKSSATSSKTPPAGTVIMTDIKTGKQGYVPLEDVKEAIASKQYRMAQ